MPQWNCLGCGALTNRSTQTWEKGQVAKETCPNCDGSHTKFTAPSDKKVWLDTAVNPHMYEQRGDELVMKPEYAKEIEDEILTVTRRQAELVERKKAERRALRHARRNALTPAEIERITNETRNYVRECEARGLEPFAELREGN